MPTALSQPLGFTIRRRKRRKGRKFGRIREKGKDILALCKVIELLFN
jgi:hypothetical protein